MVVGGKDMITRVFERDGAAEAGPCRHFSLSVFCFLFSLLVLEGVLMMVYKVGKYNLSG